VADDRGHVARPGIGSHGPITAWSGWDPRSGATVDPAAIFSADHEREAAYDLLAVTARGFRPPRFLRTTILPDTGDDGYVEEDHETLKMTWSLLYRRVAETGPALVAPYGIYLLGVNPPADMTEADLDVFNDFYTNVHMPEVAERRHALRAVRYELLRAIRPPYQGAPQFLAVYEVDETGVSNRRHTGPPYTSGPEVWQRHKTPWRLWYRRLSADEGSP
jgi:hypothetical protein